jgi:hypothetical protein
MLVPNYPRPRGRNPSCLILAEQLGGRASAQLAIALCFSFGARCARLSAYIPPSRGLDH